MARLTQAFFKKILAIEGGYQNRADDSGNWACGALVGTKYGVSAVAFRDWVNRCPTAAEMKNLTEAQAFDFYAWYFDRYNLYPIESQEFFELLANNTMGSPANAAKTEQRALNKLGYPVAIDGVRGQNTVAALNKAWRQNPTSIYNTIRQDWIAYLKSINKPQFLAGWLYRMDKYFPPIGAAGIGIGAAIAVLLLIFAFKRK